MSVTAGGNQGLIESHGYVYDDANRRTRHARTVATASTYVDYTYDAAGQLRSASSVGPIGQLQLNQQMAYGCDPAGNLRERKNLVLAQNFQVDEVNQLTSITRSGTLTVSGTYQGQATQITVNGQPAEVYPDHTFAKAGVVPVDGTNIFTAVVWGGTSSNSYSLTNYLPGVVSVQYDANGNLASGGLRAFAYDDENQLISVEVANAWRVEFTYDGLGRRRMTRDFTWDGYWGLTNEVRYVYDGYRVLQERNQSNQPKVTYTRGLDLSAGQAGLSGGFQGAGGIGSLLARTANSQLVVGDPSAHAYYHTDGNGNVTALVNNNLDLVAQYLYDPYGTLLSISGPMASVNLWGLRKIS